MPEQPQRSRAGGDAVYPAVLPPAPRPEPLRDVLERTGFRASLPPEYERGGAPEGQRKQGQEVAPRPDYYGLPALKKPEWKWYIPAYFVTGGVASGAYIVAALADLRGREEDRPAVCAGRYLCAAMMALSPVLLIADLGRPERFHHMLRVFQPRSMMSQGAWGLTLFGVFAGAAALAQIRDDWKRSHGAAGEAACPGQRPATVPWKSVPWKSWEALGIMPAAYIGSYTGVLLSATNVPLWAGNPYWLGPLFFASAMSSGTAGTRLAARLLGPVRPAAEERLRRAEQVSLAAEALLSAASAVALGTLGKPLRSGRVSGAYRFGHLGLGLAAPLVLGRLARKRPWLGLLGSVLALAGSAFLKYAMTEGGKESADDPQAYFTYTRARQ